MSFLHWPIDMHSLTFILASPHSVPPISPRSLFCQHRLTLIPAWISNYMHYKVWAEITHLLPTFNGAKVSVNYAIIGSDDGNMSVRCEAIIWTSNGLLPAAPPENRFHWNYNKNTAIFTQENVFENNVRKMLAISSLPQCPKMLLVHIFVAHRYSGNIYHKTSITRRALLGNETVDHSDVVGASPVGAAPTTSSFLT